MLELFSGLGYPTGKVQLLVNRFERDLDLDPVQAERLLGMPLSYLVPNSYRAVGWAINHAEPIRESAPRDPVTRAVISLVDRLIPDSEDPDRSGGSRRRFWH